MCAVRQDPIREMDEYYRYLFLHRKEMKRTKPLSRDLHWLLAQCSNIGDARLFHSLPANSEILPIERQSYQQWKSIYEMQKLARPRRMRRHVIVIQPLLYESPGYTSYCVEPLVLDYLQAFCQAYFYGMTVELATPIDLSRVRRLTKRVHKDTGREQFLVDDLMKYLKGQRPRNAFCIVGISVVDLYPGPQWNFALGHASLTDGVAVCSFGHYFNSHVSPLKTTLQQQISNIWVLVKVMTHEMGHVFGLKHCYYFNCAMNESTSIFQAAAQPLFLCPICLRKIQKVLKFDILERYQMLADQCLLLARAAVTPLDSPIVEQADGLEVDNISTSRDHNGDDEGRITVLAETVESVFIESNADTSPAITNSRSASHTPPIKYRRSSSQTPPITSISSSQILPISSSQTPSTSVSRKSSLLHTLSSVSSETFPQTPSQYFEDAQRWFERACTCLQDYQLMH